ncbi:DUF305 domain-containing protein [Limnobacter alexandrii]|jgi:uncharacterized protein (DUF305 family)|uniref:DUF305 domain-containing protein n=1 Tax=Limnobacter alexandrii TaxID=2570352 RepID=UPI001107E6E6|nr:DUF305 domain-containing protein [Limnobacter alexandrii]
MKSTLRLMSKQQLFYAVFIFSFGLAAGLALTRAIPALEISTTETTTNQSGAQANAIDIGFAQSMIIHHDQAISMAMLVKGKVSPNLDLLANGILTAQLLEMGQMKGWLNAWNQQITPPAKGAMAWVEDAKNVSNVQDLLYIAQCKASKGAMPGMLNVDQFNEMRAMTGQNLERRFLEAMIAHHEAAIPMARFAVNNGESLLVKGLAKSIIREQAAEISLMNKLLEQINAEY